ncbi:hypothetical protein LCGC14_2472650, partial [marine sediment metagenome]
MSKLANILKELASLTPEELQKLTNVLEQEDDAKIETKPKTKRRRRRKKKQEQVEDIPTIRTQPRKVKRRTKKQWPSKGVAARIEPIN